MIRDGCDPSAAESPDQGTCPESSPSANHHQAIGGHQPGAATHRSKGVGGSDLGSRAPVVPRRGQWTMMYDIVWQGPEPAAMDGQRGEPRLIHRHTRMCTIMCMAKTASATGEAPMVIESADEAEIQEAVTATLKAAGVSVDELRQQAAESHFISERARRAWFVVSPFLAHG